ncbi:MAG: alanine dehydrogenase [Oligoflexia bacterium]|nr:alanine dehydrogenase [Oligoflexia bacterium]
MIIGVPKEIKNNENRVGLTPGGAQALITKGHKVFIETKAGLGIGCADQMYEKAGATIVNTAKEIWENSEMVIKVKEPIQPEYALMKPGLILYTYLHLAAEPELTKQLMERKVSAIAYETIQLEDRSLPLLTPMSEVAGRMATQVGARYLQKNEGGKGILLSGVPGVRRGKVAIIGGGVAGTSAAVIAMGMGAQVTILDVNMNRLQYLDDIFGNSINTLYSNPVNVETAVAEADLVVGTVLIAGAKAPKLVTREMIKKMEPNSVVVDVSIDQGGCIETIRPTSHSDPIFREENVIHYGVTNMPGAVAQTSTYALTNRTLKYAMMIADLGFQKAISSDKALYKGVNVYNGKVAYKQVADDLGLPYEAAPL